jgi:hypothetical protein
LKACRACGIFLCAITILFCVDASEGVPRRLFILWRWFILVRHIVTWNYKKGFTDVENMDNALKVKSELESLIHCIDGIIELKVSINALSSSNRDIILNSLFENEETLAAYQIHPEHKRVSVFVGSVMQDRACIDYFE